MKTRLTIFILSLVLFWTSCANEGMPTGGAKDTAPPEVLGSAPPSGSLMFNSSEITLLFDEYITINNPLERIVISPPLQNPISFKIKGKKLHIQLNEDSLKSNTTYLINFTEAIQDITEKNKLNNFQYVFSTGKVIDSLSVSGRVTQAEDNKPCDGVFVMLYEGKQDSIFKTRKPDYFTKTDKNGNYSLNYLSAGEYTIYTLKDDNYSYTYDVASEGIGFYENRVNINPDTAWVIPLKLFTQKEEKLKLLNYDDSKPGRIMFAYNLPVSSFQVKYIADTAYTDTVYTFNTNKDSVDFWYHLAKEQQQRIITKANDTIMDTIRVTKQVTAESKFKPLELNTNPVINSKTIYVQPQNFIYLTLNNRAKSVVKQSITVYSDSFKAKINCEIEETGLPLKPISLRYNWGYGKEYAIKVVPGAFTDFNGATNDSLIRYFKTALKEAYGTLKISFPDLNKSNTYIIHLLDSKSNTIKETTLDSNALSIDYHLLIPNKYYIKIIEDSNKNGRWDTGDLYNKTLPEKIKISDEPINVRANWDLEIELFFNR